MSSASPFHIAEGADGLRVASNGVTSLMLLDADGRVFRRRGMRGLSTRPAADVILPQLNALAGELLQQMDMPAPEIAARLQALLGQVPTAKPEAIEWAVAELGDVRVYVDGASVIVTRKDMTP